MSLFSVSVNRRCGAVLICWGVITQCWHWFAEKDPAGRVNQWHFWTFICQESCRVLSGYSKTIPSVKCVIIWYGKEDKCKSIMATEKKKAKSCYIEHRSLAKSHEWRTKQLRSLCFVTFLLGAELRPAQNLYVEILTPSTSEGDCI